MHRRLLGDEHPEVAITLENLGGVYYRTNRYDETLRLLDQSRCYLLLRKRERSDSGRHMPPRSCF